MVNDLVFTQDAAWVTDSFAPVLLHRRYRSGWHFPSPDTHSNQADRAYVGPRIKPDT